MWVYMLYIFLEHLLTRSYHPAHHITPMNNWGTIMCGKVDWRWNSWGIVPTIRTRLLALWHFSVGLSGRTVPRITTAFRWHLFKHHITSTQPSTTISNIQTMMDQTCHRTAKLEQWVTLRCLVFQTHSKNPLHWKSCLSMNPCPYPMTELSSSHVDTNSAICSAFCLGSSSPSLAVQTINSCSAPFITLHSTAPIASSTTVSKRQCDNNTTLFYFQLRHA